MTTTRLMALAALILLADPPPGRCQPPPVSGYEAELRQGGVGLTPEELIAFLAKHTANEQGLRDRDHHARQLRSDRRAEREAAARRLAALGPAGWPALRAARTAGDPEMARLIRRFFAEPDDGRGHLAQSAVMALVQQAPPGAAEALLRYLPCAFDEATAEEVWYGLDGLTVRQGRVPPALVAALSDPVPE